MNFQTRTNKFHKLIQIQYDRVQGDSPQHPAELFAKFSKNKFSLLLWSRRFVEHETSQLSKISAECHSPFYPRFGSPSSSTSISSSASPPCTSLSGISSSLPRARRTWSPADNPLRGLFPPPCGPSPPRGPPLREPDDVPPPGLPPPVTPASTPPPRAPTSRDRISSPSRHELSMSPPNPLLSLAACQRRRKSARDITFPPRSAL